MIGRSRSAYCGPYWSMTNPAIVDQIHVGADAADADRPPLAKSRRRRSTAASAAAPRRGPTATRAAAAATLRDRSRAGSRRAARSSARTMSPVDSRSLPSDHDAIDLQHSRVRHDSRPRCRHRRPGQSRRRPTPAHRQDDASRKRRRDGLTCARRNRRSAGAAHRAHASAFLRLASASTSRSGTTPIDPAPSVITTSPRRASADERRHEVVERRHDVDRTRVAASNRRGQRVDGDARDRLLAGARRCRSARCDRQPRAPGRTPSISAAVRVIAVRLERHDQPPVQRARRGEHRGDLGRMVAVVVDDQDAVRLAAHFEPPLGAAEFRQARRDSIERQTELQRRPPPPPARSARLCRSRARSARAAERDRVCAGSSSAPRASIDRRRTANGPSVDVARGHVGVGSVDAVRRHPPRHLSAGWPPGAHRRRTRPRAP